MGRRHLNDDVDHALQLALRENRQGRQSAGQRARRSAAATLRAWMAASPHLPQDLVAALHDLLPEIGQGTMTDEWPLGLGDWPE